MNEPSGWSLIGRSILLSALAPMVLGPSTAMAQDEKPFAPRFRAIVDSPRHVQRGGEPSLRTIIKQASGEEALRRAVVTLPRQLQPNPEAVPRTCSPARLSAGTCPPRSQIGEASVATPLVPGGLHGPVLLANTGGAPEGTSGIGLPFAVVLLHGGDVDLRLDGAQRFLSDYRLRTTFSGLPDVPTTRFSLRFFGGTAGALRATRSLCVKPLDRVDVRFVAQDGRVVTASRPVTVSACDGLPRLTSAYRHFLARPSGRLIVRRGREAPGLTSVVLTLPHAFRLSSTRRLRVLVDGRRTSQRHWSVSGRRIRITAPGAYAQRIAVVLPRSTLLQPHSAAWFGDRSYIPAITRAAITDAHGRVTRYRQGVRASR